MEAGAWIQRCWANSKAEESRLCNYCQEKKNRHKKGKNNLYSTKKVILNNKSLILPGSYKT